MAETKQISIPNGKPEEFSVELLQKPSGNSFQRIVLKFTRITAKTSQKALASVEKQNKKQAKRRHVDESDTSQNPAGKKRKPNQGASRKHPKCRRELFADFPKKELKSRKAKASTDK